MKLLTVENSQLEVRPSGVCKYVCWKLQPSDAGVCRFSGLYSSAGIQRCGFLCGAHAEQVAVVDDGIADEEPAADQEGNGERQARALAKISFAGFLKCIISAKNSRMLQSRYA